MLISEIRTKIVVGGVTWLEFVENFRTELISIMLGIEPTTFVADVLLNFPTIDLSTIDFRTQLDIAGVRQTVEAAGVDWADFVTDFQNDLLNILLETVSPTFFTRVGVNYPNIDTGQLQTQVNEITTAPVIEKIDGGLSSG